VLQPLNDLGIGEFSGRLQLFLMRRDWETGSPDGDASSGSLALTLDYESAQAGPLSAGFQFMYVGRLFESGSLDPARGADWTLNNGNFTILNEAYLNLSLEPLGLTDSNIRVGRQVLNLDFAPSYQIRQKEQSYEGVFATIAAGDSLRLDAGHIERFSSWGSRDDTGNDYLEYGFVEVEDVEKRYGVDYSTAGMQFVSLNYTGLSNTALTVYDFHGQDLYNTLGAKIDTSISWFTRLVIATVFS